MSKQPNTKLGIIYGDLMSADAGRRLTGAAGHPLANGMTVDHARGGLCYAAQTAIAQMTVPLSAQSRKKLETARNALSKYDVIMRGLDAEGLSVPTLPDGWFETANGTIKMQLERRGGERRADYVRARIYPYFLALYELSFAKVPTAYYYRAEERDGPTLAFVRQAAIELDEAHERMFSWSSVAAAALLGDGEQGTLSVSLPRGDSLRRALEPFIKARAEIKIWYGEEIGPESDKAAAYRYAHNLLRFRVFSRNMN